MDFDVAIPGVGPSRVRELSTSVERMGFSGLWAAESAHNPYLRIAIAATATERLMLGTNIALAFPRSPMVTAQIAWDLSELTRGRFQLGLGTQVKAHMERRFSVPYSKPGPRLREYVLALRAIFRAFQGEEPLKFEGDFYKFSLLTDFFNPGPIEHPAVPIWIAGVNPGMARTAGEVCDGLHVHPFHTRRYVEEVLRPAISEGAERAGRSPADVRLSTGVFMIAGDDEEEIERQKFGARRQLAFYGSTPTYRPVFDLHDWGDAGEKLHALQRAGDIEGMVATITDEMLSEFAITAAWDDLASAILARYQGILDRVHPYGSFAWDDAENVERWGAVAQAVSAG